MSGSRSAAPAVRNPRGGSKDGSRKPASASRTPRALRDVLAAPGRPIDLGVRRDVESRLGHDFSRVRVHADRDAAALAALLGADAVTVGQDIFFAAGTYRPDTAEGTRLLVHELLHTIQAPDPLGALRAGRDTGAVSVASDAVEREAERIATATTTGGEPGHVRERGQQAASWLRYATVGADRQRTEHLDPATLVDRLVAGLVRSLRGDPADASGRVRLQLARFAPELRHDVLEKLETRLPSADFVRVRQQAAEADAAPGDGAVEFARTPAPVIEPDAEAEEERAAEDEARQGDDEQREQRDADAHEEATQERETEEKQAEQEDERAEDEKRDEERDKAREDEDQETEEEQDKEKSEKDKEEKDKATDDEEKKEEEDADKEKKEKGRREEKSEKEGKEQGEAAEAKPGEPGQPVAGAPGTPPPATAAPVAGPGAAADAAPVGAGGAEPVMAERVDQIAEDPNGPLARHGIVRPPGRDDQRLGPEPAIRDEMLPVEAELAAPEAAEQTEQPGPPPDLLPKTDLDVSHVPTADEEMRLAASGEPRRPREAPSFPAPPPLEPAAEEALAAEQDGAPAAGAERGFDRTAGEPVADRAPDGEAEDRGAAEPDARDLAGSVAADGSMPVAAGPRVSSEPLPRPMDLAAGAQPAALTDPGAEPVRPGAPLIPQDASLEPGGGGCAGAPEPTVEEAGGGGCGGGGGAPAAEEAQQPEEAPVDVSGQEPTAALASTAQLPPHQMRTALGGVDQSVSRTVHEEHTALAEAPPEVERPSGAPQTLHGPPETAPPAESTVGKLERVTAASAGGQERPQARAVSGRPLPAAQSPNVAGTPQGELTPDDVGNIEAAVDGVPTSDPALNTATVGSAPQVELTGETDPALTDQQSRKLTETSGRLAAIGRDDANRPLGEDQVFPDVPPETLRAQVSPPQPVAAGGAGPTGAGPTGAGPGKGPGGPGGPGGPAGVAGPGGAQMKAVSVVAQQERGPQIQASVGEGQGQMMTGRQEKDQKSEEARQQHRVEVAAAVQENVDAQAAERAKAKEEATGQRAQWRVEQDTLLTDNGRQAAEKHGSAKTDIRTEHDTKNAEIKKEQENHNGSIQQEREKAERNARAEKEKGKKEEGGFWGWVKSKVKALFDKIVSAIKAVFEAARKAVQRLIDGFKKIATGLIEAARRAIVAVIKVLADALIAIADVLLAAFPGLRDKFRKFITDLRDRAINAVNALADKLKKGVEALLDLLAKGLTALLALYEKVLLAAVEVVRSAVNKAIEFAQAAIAALGQLAALIADIAPDPIGWIKKLGSAAKEGVRQHLWGEIKIAVRQWFNEKVQSVLGLGKMIFDILVKGCMSIAEIGRMAWQAVVKALPLMIVSLVIEKLISLIIPAAGAVLAIAQGLIAAYQSISRIIAAFAKFFAFLKAVKGVAGAACLFAQAMAAGVVALLEFITNFLLIRLGMALKGVATKLKGIAKKIADKLRRPSSRPGGRPGGADGPDPQRPTRPGVAPAPRMPARPGPRSRPQAPARPGARPAPARPHRPGDRPGPQGPRRPGDRPDPRPVRPGARPDPRRPRRPGDRPRPQPPRRPGDRPDRRPDRDKGKQQDSKEARLARIVARIRPKLAGLLRRGVYRHVLGPVLNAMRAWYRLTSLRTVGATEFQIIATLNPARPAGSGIWVSPSNRQGEIYGEKFLGADIRALPADLRAAVWEYTRWSYPYNPVARGTDPAKWLRKLGRERGPRTHLLDLFGGREPVLEEIEELARRPRITRHQLNLINGVMRSPDPRRTLRDMLASPGRRPHLVAVFGGREPRLEDIEAVSRYPRPTRRQLRVLSDIVTSPDQRATLRRFLDRDLFTNKRNYERLVESFGGRFPTVADLQARMDLIDQALDRPIPAGVEVHRNLQDVEFMSGYVRDPRNPGRAMRGLVGTTQTEQAYMSTSMGEYSAFSFPGYSYRLHLRVPRGTRGLWVGYASAHPRQRELILARGTKYKILDVKGPTRGGMWDIYAEVIVPGMP